jgi:hypothetical protein
MTRLGQRKCMMVPVEFMSAMGGKRTSSVPGPVELAVGESLSRASFVSCVMGAFLLMTPSSANACSCSHKSEWADFPALRWVTVTVVVLLVILLLTASYCAVPVKVGLDIKHEIDRCSDQSHGDYIWDDAARRAACRRDDQEGTR